MKMTKERPHIVLVIARGEAVRNFLYSDTLRVLSENARVTLLSVIHDERFRERFAPYAEIVPLQTYPQARLLNWLQDVIWHAHFRWLWSEKAKNKWEILAYRARTPEAKARFMLWKGAMRALAFRPVLERLTSLYEWGAWKLRSTREFDHLFRRLQPDLVFNTAHIHAPAAELPMRVAHRMGIPTATFIFSWDNLTTRSRMTVPYDYYLVWHTRMRDELLRIYPHIRPDQVFVTGTPQFDFHFKPEFWLSREDLCRRIGVDPKRPFILYTTGRDHDFPEEHRFVLEVIRFLREARLEPAPQLVVRTYAKGTSQAMRDLAKQNIPDVVFPPILWDHKWLMPHYEDLAIYTSLLRHTALGINAASTVSLELLMHDKPVINLGFDPPGSHLPYPLRWERHVAFDHYRPIVESGATMIARSTDQLFEMIVNGLRNPRQNSEQRREFIASTFDGLLDGLAGERVAKVLIELACSKSCERI